MDRLPADLVEIRAEFCLRVTKERAQFLDSSEEERQAHLFALADRTHHTCARVSLLRATH